MKIEIRIDKNCDEPKVIVVTDKVTDAINEIVTRLSDKPSQILAGFKDGQAAVLEPEQLYRIYASDGKVYEVEQRLTSRSFARISNSELINLKKVRSFDLSLVGTICVSLSNGAVSYVSRRNVSKIKQLLGL